MTSEFPFTNLVFEGGGAKGIAYAGALQVLEQAGILGQVTAVAGTSAGAITATLVGLGYSADELTTTMLSLDMTHFEDGRLEGPARLVEHYGFCRGDAFRAWMGSHVAAKLGSPSATFADLLTERHIDLRVVATDLCSRAAEVFSPATSPDMALADAVRMSMSIPFYFAAVRTDGHVYVDGGATWNYPVEIFDDDMVNWGTLGFRFEGTTAPPTTEIHDLLGFTKCLYESLLDVQAGYFRRNPSDRRRTVVIDNLGVRATDFRLSDDQRRALITQGHQATIGYLAAYAPSDGPPTDGDGTQEIAP